MLRRLVQRGINAAAGAEPLHSAPLRACSTGFLWHRPPLPNPEDPVAKIFDADEELPLAELRWSLQMDGVAPGHSRVLHNPDTGLLLKHTTGKFGANRAVQAAQPESEFRMLMVNSNVPDFKSITVDEFDELARDVGAGAFMYDAKNLYVLDGAVGSARASEVPVRLVTDDSATAFAMSNMLHRTNRGPYMRHRDIVVLAAPHAPGEPVLAVHDNPRTGQHTIVLRGRTGVTNSPPLLLTAISLAASRRLAAATGTATALPDMIDSMQPQALQPGSVLLFGSHAALQRGQQRPTLVLAPAAVPAPSPTLYAAHGVVWARDHIAAAFAGVQLEASAQGVTVGARDLIVNGVLTRRLPRNNAVKPPARMLIASPNATASRTLSVTDARDLLATDMAAVLLGGADSAFAGERADKVAALVKEHEVEVVEVPQEEARAALRE